MDKHRDDIPQGKLPRHVAIIMDGNGRWAQQRGQHRTFGHLRGVESVRKVVEAAREAGIPYLTLYTFSTENWNRPPDEVDSLMNLLADSLENEREDLIRNKIRLAVVGDLDGLPAHVRAKFDDLLKATSQDYELTLSLALNYGGRIEILKAVEQWCRRHPGRIPSPEEWEAGLQSAFLPDVDLMIRTGGEKRISNFLLWKLAYAELYFTDVLWPDFGKKEFFDALRDYQQRERRFGKTSEQIQNDEN